jgi:peptidoglycan/LPS O-acetylase OafA/YrhL
LLYHLGTTGVTLAGGQSAFMPGGFLGVDVFFVLSGFLITSLLMAERAQTGRISIKTFYIRRARRLLPALYTMMIVVAVAGAFFYTERASTLRGDLTAAFTYVTNWWLIGQGSSYFGAGVNPPLLTHLWSLAVEEQFYVIWPLVLIVLTRNSWRQGRRRAMWVTGIAIIASAALAAVLFSPWHDPSRVYYGTDTRAATPLVGAFLAVALRPWMWRASITQAARLVIDLASVVALAWLTVACISSKDTSPTLYRGGFLFIALTAGVLVIGAAHPASHVGKVLGIAPLRWIGERSYAIYLWHWPIFAVTRPGVDIPLGELSSSLLRVGLTLLLAHLSFRFVETPLRSGAIGRWWARWKAAPARPRRSMATRLAFITVFVLVSGLIVSARLGAAKAPASVPVGGPDTTLESSPTPSASPSNSPSPSASVSASPTAKPVGGLTVPPVVPSVGVFGDSQGMTLLLNTPTNIGKYVKFKDHTIEGCGILLGRVTSRSGERRDLAANCPNWLSVWRQRAAGMHPDLALVMLGAWDVFDLTVSGHTMAFGSPEWDANWKAALQQGIQALAESGAKVVLSLSPCYRPVRASAGYWPERGDDARTRHLNDLMRATAAVTGAYTVDPPSQFCTDPKISKSLSYRWDGVHYYKPGALLYCQAVVPQLLAIFEGH